MTFPKQVLGFLLTGIVVIAGLILLASPTPNRVKADTPTFRLGIMGDSGADEYRADDARARGTIYANTTLNWVELLARYKGADVGTWGSWSDSRRNGYEYNWAKSGAEAATLIADGQHTGLAAQVAAGKIDIAYLSIGANDFAYYRDGASIYNGTLSGSALTTKINNFNTNVQTAITAVLNASPTIKIVVLTVGDAGLSPVWQTQFPDAAKRQRVTDAIDQVNNAIRAQAANNPRIILADATTLFSTLASRLNSQGDIIVGSEAIHFAAVGDEPHNATLSDGIHAGTVLEGLVDNALIPYINQGLNFSLSPFSDSEVLANAGIVPANSIHQVLQVSSSADDADTSSGTASTLQVGGDNTYFAGFRFAASIPQGATIQNAYLEMFSPSASWIGIHYDIYAENVGNSAPLTSASLATRTKTTSVVPHYSDVSWAASSWQRSEVLKAAIQEIINRADWNSGNNLTVLLHGTGSTFGRKAIGSFDGSSANAPRLIVDYTLASGSATPVPTATPSATPTPSPIVTPTPLPTATPTPVPTPTPTPAPTPTPTVAPTATPTPRPTATPTPQPTPAPYSIRINTKPNSASQFYMIFDGIRENGATNTEVTSPRFTYSSGWTLSPNQGINNSPFRYATTASKTVTFTTSATTLEIMTLRRPEMGSFEVYVNNVLRVTYNANAATQSFVNVSVPLP